jgi:HTH-type transcriptional regulator/antitoxin HigA
MADHRPDHEVSYVPREFVPDWGAPPGALIQRELDARGFSQADVAARSNISAKHVNQLLRGHVPLSPDVALALERVLGVPAELWLRMDISWQAAKARKNAHESLSSLLQWKKKFPASELTRNEVINPNSQPSEQVDELLRFFQVADINAFDRVWLAPQANYKRSQKFTVDPYATALWRRLAERQAQEQLDDAGTYDHAVLRAVAAKLPPLTREPARTGLHCARQQLRSAGVLLAFVPEILGTRLCGATWWLSASHPVIALSGRHKFADVYWFTLLHEIAHVLLHPKRITYLDFDGKIVVDEDADRQEGAANTFAENILLPENYRRELLLLQTHDEMIQFADRVGISPGVAAGQYGHYTEDWRRFGKLRETIEFSDIIDAS